MSSRPKSQDSNAVRDQVRHGYSEIARRGVWLGENTTETDASADDASSCCSGGSCCGLTTLDAETLAEQIGYSREEIEKLPEGTNLGLSCGNPTAIASLKPGEVVLDLGAGAGFDVFLAGPKVGPEGRAIGVDMTPDMLSKARESVRIYHEQTGLSNIEFRLGEIEHLPVADNSVDCIISNCVINLSPDKEQVWREMARVLKPGGRVAVSDMALLKPLPDDVVDMVETWVGCVAGAVLVSETEQMARQAGLIDIKLDAKPEYIEAMSDFQDPLYTKIAGALPAGEKPSAYLTSLDIVACKPAAPCCCG